jgi:lipid A 3-O-deacylase
MSARSDNPMNNSFCLRACVAGLLMSTAATLRAQWFDQGPIFTMIEENDTFFNTDRYYTQGLKMTYLHTQNVVPHWVDHLSDDIPALGFSVKALRIGTEVGQDIYTPADIHNPNPQPNDPPFAGYLYTGLIIQRSGLTAGNRPVLENFQVDLGIIGPGSLAEEAQNLFHDNAETRRAWDNQLKNEPGIAVKYERSWLLSPSPADEERYFDFIPHTGFSLGNFETSFRAGGTARVGFHLPDDFGVKNVHSLTTQEGGRSAEQQKGGYGCYLFGDAEGWLVGYDASLNGNLYQDSGHVTPEALVGVFTGGLAVTTPWAELDVSAFNRTKEFTTQAKRGGTYGSIVLKFKF